MNAADISQARNTILAALRYYQEQGQGDPFNRSYAIHDIATNGEEETSLDAEGIDGLCIALNMGKLVIVEGGMEVIYHEDGITIQDDEGNEVVHWIEDEWREDSQVVFSIVNAAVLAVTDPEELINVLKGGTRQ